MTPDSSSEFTGTPRLLTRARNVGALPCTDRPNSIRLLEYTPLLYTDSEATRMTKFSAEATMLLSR